MPAPPPLSLPAIVRTIGRDDVGAAASDAGGGTVEKLVWAHVQKIPPMTERVQERHGSEP